MELQLQVGIVAIVLGFCATAILCYEIYSKKGKLDHKVQGAIAIFGGLICFVSLFYPWIELTKQGILFEFIGLDVGESYVLLYQTQIVKIVAMFMFLFGNLIILGGFLRLVGYGLGKQLITFSSVAALLVSVVLIFSLGFFPVSEAEISFEVSPWLYIAGSILGVISARLEIGK